MLSESIYMPSEDPEAFIDITNNPITDILACSLSLNRSKTLICTVSGFCLVNNSTRLFKRFENDESPFSKSSSRGVALGSILDERTEVALVPQMNSSKFKKTSVYIFGKPPITQITGSGTSCIRTTSPCRSGS